MFEFFKKKNDQGENDYLKKLIQTIDEKTFNGKSYSMVGTTDTDEYKSLKKRSNEEIKDLLIQLLDRYILLNSNHIKLKGKNKEKREYYSIHIIVSLVEGLMRKKLDFNEDEWIAVFNRYKLIIDGNAKHPNTFPRINIFPINNTIRQIEYYQKDNTLSPKLKTYIKEISKWKVFSDREAQRTYYDTDLIKASNKLNALLNKNDEDYQFELKSDDIGLNVHNIISNIKANQAEFNQIFLLASGVSGSKPTNKFTIALDNYLDTIGLNKYRQKVHEILKIPTVLKAKTVTKTYEYRGGTNEYTETTFLSTLSQNFIKGLVWSCYRFSDKDTIRLLIKLAEKCYVKIPGKGPAAASVGNACVYILGNMKGKDGLGALSRLKLKVRQNNVKKMIDKLLVSGAEKYNVSVEELKEMAVPQYGLEAGEKHIDFEDYRLYISIKDSKVNQLWKKADNSVIKSVPSKVKNSIILKKKLQNVRKELKEIQKVFSAQKQRIDNQYILDRSWDFNSFKKYYLNHGLVYPIASKLIWSFKKGNNETEAVLINKKWHSIDGKVVKWIDVNSTVKLWHPINATENEIVKWRKKMIELEWRQPIKQAYREIYLLTEAEVNTRSYSNRMAAHILKQHQFSSLANIRNWKYSLMGAYDDGIHNQICSKVLPEHGITAEFWIDELNQEDAFNEAGIWLYIATDQVKFKNREDNTIDLVDIPKIVFTEIMRDVDLFVGVSSVGNDPQWIDNNGERQTNRDYWHSYSFGDLTEIAKTRKEILSGLLPRLKKIRDKAKIEGKFLIVKGSIRTYKIHIGSGNILMEPNDQYLCIVPSRSADKSTKNLFIPFEGDKGLSIVLSKAFLLAEDDKIEDETITSQIKIR